MCKAASRQVSRCLVPRWWGTVVEEEEAGDWKANWGSLLKGEKSFFPPTPQTLAWDDQTRTFLLLCRFSAVFKERGKSEKEICAIHLLLPPVKYQS